MKIINNLELKAKILNIITNNIKKEINNKNSFDKVLWIKLINTKACMINNSNK